MSVNVNYLLLRKLPADSERLTFMIYCHHTDADAGDDDLSKVGNPFPGHIF